MITPAADPSAVAQKALAGAAIGAGVGLLGSGILWAVQDNQSTEQAPLVALLFSGIGAATGAVIGVLVGIGQGS